MYVHLFIYGRRRERERKNLKRERERKNLKRERERGKRKTK
jgi:hypothetical protein